MLENNEKLADYLNRRNLFSYSGQSSFISPANNHKIIDERLPNFMGLIHNLLKSIKFTVSLLGSCLCPTYCSGNLEIAAVAFNHAAYISPEVF